SSGGRLESIPVHFQNVSQNAWLRRNSNQLLFQGALLDTPKVVLSNKGFVRQPARHFASGFHYSLPVIIRQSVYASSTTLNNKRPTSQLFEPRGQPLI